MSENNLNEAAAVVRPTQEQLERELERERYKRTFLGTLRSTIFTLVIVAAVAILVAVLLLPVLKIYGKSMTPTLAEGNIVLSVKGSSFETGDVIAFYYNNKILVKRVIAQPGQWVDIDKDGTVYVDNQAINEPYVTEKAFGECDLDLPYQVPESRIFVMGDHRSVSIDSRSSAIGCVAEEQIVGRIVFRVWPLNHFGRVK
ncbi:MAG: signal peptidase I [Eubacterium sp.]|nr:signal peptidase I [Eubacterium sp.]